MQNSDHNKPYKIVGQHPVFNYLILAMLAVLIPVTAWGMWTSGEVSVWFVIAFVVVFGAASPFILNDLIKPTFAFGILDPVQKTVELKMAGLLNKQSHMRKFLDIEVVQLNMVEGHIEQPRGRQVNTAIMRFKDGLEVTVLKSHRAGMIKAEFEDLSRFLKTNYRLVNIQEKSITRADMLRGVTS